MRTLASIIASDVPQPFSDFGTSVTYTPANGLPEFETTVITITVSPDLYLNREVTADTLICRILHSAFTDNYLDEPTVKKSGESGDVITRLGINDDSTLATESYEIFEILKRPLSTTDFWELLLIRNIRYGPR
jgi:hypothetical protein